MSRLSSARMMYLAGAVLLALPVLPHLADLFRFTYSFQDSYLGGNPGPPAWLRFADFLWVGVCLAGLLALYRRAGTAWPAWSIAVAAVAFTLVPPFGSYDAVFYFRMAERWAGGVNPYAAPFSVFNPFLGVGLAAVGDYLPYPPLWVIVCGALHRVAGGHLLGFFLLLKLLMGACHAGNFFILRRLLAGRPAGEAAAWAYLAHPLLLLEGLSMMHFDLLWLLGCLAAAWQLRQGRWWPAVLTWTAAFWIKYSAAFALPLFLPALCDAGQPLRRRLARLVGGAAIALAAGATASQPFGRLPELLVGGFLQIGWEANSLLLALRNLIPETVGRTGWIQAALGLAALALLLAVRPKPDPRTHDGAAAWVVLALLAYLLLASPVFWPWYAIWPLVFSFLLTDTRWVWLGRVAEVFAATAFLYYPLLFIVGQIQFRHDPVMEALYALLAHAPALAVMVAGLRDHARGRTLSGIA
ncbi:MAG TPA: hypothetical protein PLK89_13870 [Acidobacteriota bacterium]|nr:hypothetical protein [Acidobacteriota bacterium]